MPHKKRSTGRTTFRTSDNRFCEWEGGAVRLSGTVSEAGEPFWPEAFCWIGADGAVLSVKIGTPAEMDSLVVDSLRSAIEDPLVGRPRTPTRVDSPLPSWPSGFGTSSRRSKSFALQPRISTP